jgi:nucleotide-binding universal stress UspA family protein
MFERIMLATNDSRSSRKAVWATVDLAERYRSEVLVLHVLERPTDTPAPDAGGSANDSTEFVDEAVRILKDASVSARGETRMSASGSVPRMIVETASEHEASLIVIGSRDRSDGDELSLENVTQRVLHIAPCPVLVIR